MKKLERLNDFLGAQVNRLPSPIWEIVFMMWFYSTLVFFIVSPVLLFNGKYFFAFLTAIQPIHFSISVIWSIADYTPPDYYDMYKSIGFKYNFDRSIKGDYIIFNGTYYNLSEIKKSLISLLYKEQHLYVFGDVVRHYSNEPKYVNDYDLYIGLHKIYLIKIQRVCGTGFFGNKYDIDIEIPFLNHEEANDFIELIVNK